MAYRVNTLPERSKLDAAKRSAPIKAIQGSNCGIIEGMHLTATQCANIAGVSAVAIGNLEKAGWFKRDDTGFFEAVAFIRGWSAYKDELRKRAGTKQGAANRIQEARAIEIELRTARDAGELIEMSAAIGVVQSIAGETRAVFGALPARFTRDLEMRAKLETMVNEGFNQIADRLEREMAALACSDGVDLSSADE
jgi:phage terminase Nu1 subunit (DNA packaging protein)